MHSLFLSINLRLFLEVKAKENNMDTTSKRSVIVSRSTTARLGTTRNLEGIIAQESREPCKHRYAMRTFGSRDAFLESIM